MQRERIRFGNRVNAIADGRDEQIPEAQKKLRRYYDQFQKLEEELNEDIADIVKDYSIWPHISKVKGIGPMYAAKMISLIDIHRATQVSDLWRFAGQGVMPKMDSDGLVVVGKVPRGNGDDNEVFWFEEDAVIYERERLVKGQKAHYCRDLKTVMYLVGVSFVKCRSPYRVVYDAAKTRYVVTHPEWTKMHVHLASLRKMVKLFLSHTYEQWRTLEGLSVCKPYVIEVLGHDNYRPPEDFGWPRL